jgi:hypothetical protein
MEALLKSSLDVLRDIRSELHGNVDDSVIRQIDALMHDWQAALEGNSKRDISPKEVLNVLGELIRWLPGIIELIERLNK